MCAFSALIITTPTGNGLPSFGEGILRLVRVGVLIEIEFYQ